MTGRVGCRADTIAIITGEVSIALKSRGSSRIAGGGADSGASGIDPAGGRDAAAKAAVDENTNVKSPEDEISKIAGHI
jgi:hypothetical protein